MSRNITNPGPAERELITDALRLALALVKQYARIEVHPPIDPPTLDTTYSIWMSERSHSDEGFEANLDAFAFAFGQYLVDRLGMQWVVVSDREGAELAVRGQPGAIVIYPWTLVRKRFAARQTGFFQTTYVDVRRQLEWALRKGRPWWKFGRG